jgi:hypothetical protein
MEIPINSTVLKLRTGPDVAHSVILATQEAEIRRIAV